MHRSEYIIYVICIILNLVMDIHNIYLQGRD